MLVFSEMKPGDVDRVHEMECTIFSEPWSKADFLRMTELDFAYYIVAKEDGDIVGYCGVRNMCGDGEITNVAVREDQRGRGLGEKMLRFLMQEGNARGIENYTLEVRKSNAPAIGLYEKLGFSCEGIRKNFYEKPVEDCLIYWKRKKDA